MLDEITFLLKPYFIALTMSERRKFIKIGAGYIRFLELSHGIAVDYPEMFPSFLKVAAFRDEYSVTRELHKVSGKLDLLRNSVNDTEMLAGRHTLETALAFYNTVKIAARRDIPGARPIYEELKPALRSGIGRQRKVEKDRRQPELFGDSELKQLRDIR